MVLGFRAINEQGAYENLQSKEEFLARKEKCERDLKQKSVIGNVNKIGIHTLIKQQQKNQQGNIINPIKGSLSPETIKSLETTPELFEFIKSNPTFVDEEAGVQYEYVVIQVSRGNSACASSIRNKRY